MKGDHYKQCCKAFCDGLEFCLGGISKETASKNVEALLGWLNSNVKSLIFKHAIFKTRGSETFVWITLNPETTKLSPRTMIHFLKTKAALQEHALSYWGCSREVASQIELSKIDAAIDMKGSFLPNLGKSYRDEIAQRLSLVIQEVFRSDFCNFLTLGSINGLHLTQGSNNLDTCYQYAVLDEDQDKLLNIKMYDKTLDLIGRDGTQMVGSRLSQILGCRGQFNTFIKRVC